MKTIKLIYFVVAAAAFCATASVRAESVRGKNELGTRITVVGAVNKPGILKLTVPTVIAALAESGGWNRLANLKQVGILRRNGEGKGERIVVDVAAILSGSGEDPKLQNGDVIHVPEKIL